LNQMYRDDGGGGSGEGGRYVELTTLPDKYADGLEI